MSAPRPSGAGRILLPRGTLWDATRARSESALACGALQPIATETVRVEEDGVVFVAHLLGRLQRKLDSDSRQRASGHNPFLPYEEALCVAEVSDTHVCLLNKFNVLDHHLLIVTREFEAQESPLTPADFAATFACLTEGDALAFYNAGVAAGASQPHKHLQLVPLPLAGGPERLPLGPRIAAGALPFRHALAPLADLAERPPEEAGEAAARRSRELLREIGCEGGRPYNLLATREWMLVVPRTRGTYDGIPVNALGYAGALLVPDAAALERLRARGPFALLRAVTAP